MYTTKEMDAMVTAVTKQASLAKKTKLGEKLDACVEEICDDYKELHTLKEDLLTQSRTLSDLVHDHALSTDRTKKRDFELAVTDIDHTAMSFSDKLANLESSIEELKERAEKAEKRHSAALVALKGTRQSFYQYASLQIQKRIREKKKPSLSTQQLKDRTLAKVNSFLDPEVSLADIAGV